MIRTTRVLVTAFPNEFFLGTLDPSSPFSAEIFEFDPLLEIRPKTPQRPSLHNVLPILSIVIKHSTIDSMSKSDKKLLWCILRKDWSKIFIPSGAREDVLKRLFIEGDLYLHLAGPGASE